ncbi:unnamed protein product [Caenorhabditis nigoni]
MNTIAGHVQSNDNIGLDDTMTLTMRIFTRNASMAKFQIKPCCEICRRTSSRPPFKSRRYTKDMAGRRVRTAKADESVHRENRPINSAKSIGKNRILRTTIGQDEGSDS